MAKFSFEYTVLEFGAVGFIDSSFTECLAKHTGLSARVEHASNIDELIELLLTYDRCVIVAAWDEEGVPDTIKSLKVDEAVSLVPVLAVTAEDRNIADAYKRGVDLCLRADEAVEYACHNVAALLNRQTTMKEMVGSLSELKSEAVNSFLLADLIRPYVPTTVWELAMEHAKEQKLDIQHSELDLTIVFADIAQFTRITQHLSPGNVIIKLNAVFEIVTGIVYSNGGDIDKFIGDAFFAVFEEPAAAIAAVTSIQQKIDEMNTHENQGNEAFQLRVGVHTGTVIRGNVGGGPRYDNTLIGDSVNVASRLESIAPPGGIVISDATRRQAGLPADRGEKMEVDLRGRDEPITAFRIYPE